MKKLKIIVGCLLAVVLLTSATPNSVLADTKYGFTYDTSQMNVEWKSMNSFNVYSSVGKKLGTCSYFVGLARDKDTNNYMVMTRAVMTPNESKVKISSSKYGYGFSEYLSVKVDLPSLDDYVPQNQPKEDKWTLSLGVDGSGAGIEASYPVTHSDLDITESCDTPSGLYYIKYNYKPSIANPFGNNKYLANESRQLGIASFETDSSKVKFTMNYEARFGCASDNAASPWCIYINNINTNVGAKEYEFSLQKE